MTIATGAVRAAALAAAGQSNNPIVTGASITGTYSTAAAVEVTSASSAFSGTTFDPWTALITGTTAQLRVDFGSAQTPTFAAIAAHNMGDLGGAVRVMYSDDGVSYTSTEAGVVLPTDNQSIGFRFDDGAHRYWLFLFSSLSASDVVSVGVAWIGTEIILPQELYEGYRPPLTPTEVDLRTNVSEGSHLVGSAFVERGSTFSADMSIISPAFLRGATWTAFQRRWNQGHGSFWAWRPTKYGDLFYAWRNGGLIAPTNTGPREFMGFVLEGRMYHDV